jgi:hypothetical protein
MAADPYRLLGAIRRRVLDTPALLAVLPGGAFSGLGDADTPRPYASLSEVSNTPHDWDTSGTRWVHSVVQATIHADTLEQAAQAAWTWGQVFHPNVPPPALQGGTIKRHWTADSHQLPRDELGQAATRDFRIVVEVHAEIQLDPPTP